MIETGNASILISKDLKAHAFLAGSRLSRSRLLLFLLRLGISALLAFLASWRSRPIKTDSEIRSVSMLIAVHNGARFITDKLRDPRDPGQEAVN